MSTTGEDISGQGLIPLKIMVEKYAQKPVVNKYVSQEFQDFGVRLAMELGDEQHKSLYIKMAKTYPRSLLEAALRFVSDAQARSKGKLFMWKIKQLKLAQKKP